MLVQEKVRFCTGCKIIGMLFFALLDPTNHDTKQANKRVYIQMKNKTNKNSDKWYHSIKKLVLPYLCVQVTFFFPL